ncbi:hypothetical protein RMSM_06578 [Rhodopirellula maiorica SM1]|uniref:Uncharacterized protein n=1 Tax=Rhodopirellula maiorica SM1 TaxID=1265738 RepID=M5RR89_9BACT|nr:DUF2200 family protein [Rhodopirellula maiorica]EMI16484.1 hypothetical protein RMSM_06578 [Rhodopirellula maiorica SM1]
MNRTADHDERIAKMTFASVYPHYLAKVEKKGRNQNELLQVIHWLTGTLARQLGMPTTGILEHSSPLINTNRSAGSALPELLRC